MAEWQGQAGLFARSARDPGPASPAIQRIVGLAGLWFFGWLVLGLAEMGWRSHQIAGWAAVTPGPSFWAARHTPCFVILGATLAIGSLMPRLFGGQLALRLTVMCALAPVGAAAAMIADRGYYGVAGSQVVVRPSQFWRPDVRFPVSAATPVLRRCYQQVHRGSITNRVTFEVRYSGPDGVTDIDLGRDVRLSNVARWLGAVGDLGPTPLAGAYKTNVVQIAPAVRVAYVTGGAEPACMARYLGVLDSDEEAQFERLLE